MRAPLPTSLLLLVVACYSATCGLVGGGAQAFVQPSQNRRRHHQGRVPSIVASRAPPLVVPLDGFRDSFLGGFSSKWRKEGASSSSSSSSSEGRDAKEKGTVALGRRSSISRRIRRSAGVVAGAALIWASARAGPARASSPAAAAAPNEGPSAARLSLERMVDSYVEEVMFDDDAYDPVESVYREAVEDAVRGSHPRALGDVASSVFGRDGARAVRGEGAGGKSSKGFGGAMLSSVQFLQRRAGLTETAAILVLSGTFVVAGPMAFLLVSMMVGAQSKRQMNSVMKKRYGDTYT